MNTNNFIEGANLLTTGMVTVFIFLGVLILAINLIKLLFSERIETISPSPIPNNNEISNDHLRHMVGGRGGQSNISEKNERIFNGEFPEKPGALLEFLESFGNQWNISLFHYRNIGSAYGNILIGIEDTHKNKSLLLKHLHKCGTAFKEESNNKAYLDFLK